MGRSAVQPLPGVALGVFPLALALCANHMGHVCTGSSCVALCVPACVVGGLVAGVTEGQRWGWTSPATLLALDRRHRGRLGEVTCVGEDP